MYGVFVLNVEYFFDDEFLGVGYVYFVVVEDYVFFFFLGYFLEISFVEFFVVILVSMICVGVYFIIYFILFVNEVCGDILIDKFF